MSPLPPKSLEASGFHDAECAGYLADLALWLALAETTGGPIADLGAGTGRVSLPLAAAGHDVLAVDLDADLLAELELRAQSQGSRVRTARADLRTLAADLPAEVPHAALVLIPMQTIQLLGGPDARRDALAGAASIALPGAELAVSIVSEVESFDGRNEFPSMLPPDVAVLGGYRFESTPLAVLQDGQAAPIDMHRQRVVRDATGSILGAPEDVVITLNPVTEQQLQAEAVDAGWLLGEVISLPATDEHAGGLVLTFRLPGTDAA
ncbi:MAG: class I SAM-dependent methyltransferase [Solirubrobacteraceae bacterium]|nr:class I SAM-dependent methyltransferase [Solirubrobacteraceae bacterium]